MTIRLQKGTTTYNWSSEDDVGSIKAGIAPSNEPFCFVYNLPETFSIKTARKLALELLRWADFVEDIPEEGED